MARRTGMERRVLRVVRKVCLLGEPGVGKTSLVRRLLSGTFDPEQRATIGASVSDSAVVVSCPESGMEVHLRLRIWDITGHRQPVMSPRAFLRGAHGALVVADASRPETLNATIDWLDELKGEAGDVPVVLILNKIDISDLERLDLELLKDICTGFGCEFRTASARTGQDVVGSFQQLFRKLARRALDVPSGGAA
ncbi:MAG: GTP-binding protein [Thermoplasmatota archaeon]